MSEDHRFPAARDGQPVCGRQPLVEAITTFLAYRHSSSLGEIRAALERTIDEAGPEAIGMLSERLMHVGSDWNYFPRDPLASRIHHVLAGPVLQQEPVVSGDGHLDLVADKPVVMFANHLSYSDANVIDVLFQRIGRRDICDRLTVIAGPKVYSNVRRRFSSLCFGTIKVPQNTARSSEEAVMTVREVARGAQRALHIAQERLRLGEVLLVFAEGSRSREGRMQQLLSGVARYIKSQETWVLPVGLTGTEKLFPLAEDGLNPVPITLRIARPIPAAVLEARARGDRRLIMDAVGYAIAELLPPEYRGVYDAVASHDERARLIAHELFRSD